MVKLTKNQNIKVRPANERGHANHGWLNSYFTFSFADYHDPDQMGFRTLRVINDDTIEPEGGFDTHSHKDMEIISYVVEGELEHKDSMGNGSIIKAGNIQRMTAGTGVRHSEFNPSSENKTRLLQIWIVPEQIGLPPSYQELCVNELREENVLKQLTSNEESEGIIKIHQDVHLYYAYLRDDKVVKYNIAQGRGVWVQIVKGEVNINGINYHQGDGISIENEEEINLSSAKEGEFLLFDLA